VGSEETEEFFSPFIESAKPWEQLPLSSAPIYPNKQKAACSFTEVAALIKVWSFF
jgi:hypothetical protein